MKGFERIIMGSFGYRVYKGIRDILNNYPAKSRGISPDT